MVQVQLAAQGSSSLQVSGTAATGAAMANAAVEVKCAAGGGTTTTSATGTYALALTGATLPCMVRVTSSGAAIVLHSVVETGTTSGSTTSATANVTPLTELVVAQLVAALPAEVFAAFDAAKAGQITTATLTGATSAVVAALKDAGIDLGAIDPFKTQLVAATGSTTGNAYDQLLDTFRASVPPEALPQLVTQVANASAVQSTSALGDAMTAVEGGALPGCSYALSGKYRTIDYWGKTVVREVNFKTGAFQASNGVDVLTMVQDTTNPCAVTASGVIDGQTAEWQIAFAPGGVGVYRARFTAPTATPGTVGYIFPVQTHAYSELAGTWTLVQSGYFPDDGVTHFTGQLTFNADRSTTVCDYVPGVWNCAADASANLRTSDRSDGGFNLDEGSTSGVANLYAYRSPAGTLTVFGTTNASGSTAAGVEQSSLVLVKPNALAVPAVNSTTRFAETRITVPDAPGVRSTSPMASEVMDIQSVDTSTSTITRRRESDGRVETLHFNAPLTGWRKRDAGTDFAAAYQLPLPGLSVTLSINTEVGPTFFYSVSAVRP